MRLVFLIFSSLFFLTCAAREDKHVIRLDSKGNEYKTFISFTPNIENGDRIESFGDYAGELLFCEEQSFNTEHCLRLSNANLPYTFKTPIRSIRNTILIDNNLIIYSDRFHLEAQGNLTKGKRLTIEKNSIQAFNHLSFEANIIDFGTLRIGHGTPQEQLYSSGWIEITNDKIITTTSYGNNTTCEKHLHGLNIQDSIFVHFCQEGIENVLYIQTGTQDFILRNIPMWGCNGTIFAECDNGNLFDCNLRWTCDRYSSPIWIFGDSYLGKSSNKWSYHMMHDNIENVLVSGFPGAHSIDGLSDLKTALQHGTPQYILWALGMNDADYQNEVNPYWYATFNEVQSICMQKGITLITTSIPTVKGGYVTDTNDYNKRIHKYKNDIIKSSGCRIIDLEDALGADRESGEWREGLLAADGVHPTSAGAEAIYKKILIDFPELKEAIRRVDIVDTREQCDRPTIYYEGGMLLVTSTTPNSYCYYTLHNEDACENVLVNNKGLPLQSSQIISAYACSDNYRKSDTTFATLWYIPTGDKEDSLEDIIQIPSSPILINTNGSIITLSGINFATEVAFYTIGGERLGAMRPNEGQVVFDTRQPQGSTIIISVNERSIKVLLH